MALGMLAVSQAHAQYATGGTGAYRPQIFWVDFGTNGTNVYTGATVTRGFNTGTPASAANRLDITCTVGGASTINGTAGLYVYTPGNWQGDGLDNLYNIGGSQNGAGANPNTLSNGLSVNNGATVEFNFSCSATLAGAPFALNGLVFADAEASGSAEYVGAQLTGGGTLRIIDQISQCGTSSTVNLLAGTPSEIRFNGPAAPAVSCENNATAALRGGPALVGFIDGATSGRVRISGGGVSAVALGSLLSLEFSEAIPASYGNAAHVLNASFTGGVAATGVNFNNPANLAQLVPGPRLGATAVPDADANGAIGGADVDALPKATGPAGAGYADVTPPRAIPGSAYSIANVACVGAAPVAGWIDFNGNGTFEANERSAVVNCPAGNNTVTLAWTVPAGVVAQQTTYLRLRMASTAAALASATGPVTGGEAEDYRLRFASSDLSITKTNTPAQGPSDQPADTLAPGTSTSYSIIASNAGPVAADGTVLRDPPPAGLTCTTASCAVTSGTATCPSTTGAALVTALQSAGGIAIPTLPVNSSVTLTVVCNVQ